MIRARTKEWAGKIPAGWSDGRLKDSFFYSKGLNITKADLVDDGVAVVSYGQIHAKHNSGTHLDPSLIRYVPEEIAIACPNSKLKRGDVVFADTSEDLEGVGNCVLNDSDGVVYAGYHALIARARFPEHSKYLSYLFQTDAWRGQIRTRASGIKVFSLTQRVLNPVTVILPPLPEQKRIATFLDAKCADIDRAIAAKRKQLDCIDEMWKNILLKATVYGIDGEQLKPSGDVFYPEIPASWRALKTVHCLSMPITDGPHTTPELFDDGVPFVSAEAVSNGRGRIDFSRIRGYISEDFYEECCKKYIPQVNDVYMVKSGATTGRVAIVDNDRKFTIWSPLAVFRAREYRMTAKYLYYSIQSPYYAKQVELNWSFGTQQNIGMRVLERLKLFAPPINQQYRIVDYLDAKRKNLDELKDNLRRQIEVLEQYRKSLIHECVTGKRRIEE